MMGGQVGVADHVTIGDGAMLGAQSGACRMFRPGALDRLAGAAGARLYEGRRRCCASSTRAAGKREGDE